ncbi:PhoD-like phosphatase-domain-containing protein [Schizophyllum amplum]|uniref:PhoD-like phosphatase-domain-containing protein n=1 Tax=Schizophyllum amplum TaxID=97359 RepID=A0A550C1L5_9AGAR|nr:PhoD-like phosphatase-domain-containing protein [Auriculariopsis ampla]
MYLLYLLFSVSAVAASSLLNRNLAYRSPLSNVPQLAHDTSAIEKRHVQFAKRQMQDASDFVDEHYPTFYGADFSNSPYVWSGGIDFTHSGTGDPYDTSVLLWTRAAPSSDSAAQPDQSVPVCVTYTISASPDLSSPIDTGAAFTSYDVDFTLKVEATGLPPDSVLYYQFADCTNAESASPVGSTRTLPSPDEVNGGEPLTLAVFSCSQYQSGPLLQRLWCWQPKTSADFFVHLGDYIYESLGNGGPIGREVTGRELATLADYRERLAQYRTDASLLAAHQHAPWITVWDDHEIADNAWKAGTADSNDTAAGCAFSASGACFTDRKLAGVRAYHEWLPVRQVAADDQLRIWRGFQFGKLLDLMMLDTRQYDRDVTDVYYNTEFIGGLASYANRSLMGAQQEQCKCTISWLADTLSQSQDRGAVWRVLGQQIDAWDGYTANRARILNHINASAIDNTIILSGDSHANWVSDLACDYDPTTGAGALGVEFAGTAVTSGSSFGSDITPSAADALSMVLVESNTALQWSEGYYRGFFTLTVSPEWMNATYYAMENITYANVDGFSSANFTVRAGENKLSRPVAGGDVRAGALKL